MKKINNKTKNWKWIVQNKNTGLFCNKDIRYSYTKSLKNSKLFPSRSAARSMKFEDETVKKVLFQGKNVIHIVS